MKTKLFLLALGAAGSVTLAFAQQDPSQSDKQGGPPPPPPHPPMFIKILEAVDTDHDGIISAEEIAAAPDTLKTLDENSDGQLSKDEFLPPPPPPRPDGLQNGGGQSNGNRPQRKTKITTKGSSDSSVTKGGSETSDEGKHGPPLPLIIVALDADHDGVISAAEIAGSAEALKTLDKNDDSQLGPGEYAHPPRPPKDDGAQGQQGGQGGGQSDDGQKSQSSKTSE